MDCFKTEYDVWYYILQCDFDAEESEEIGRWKVKALYQLELDEVGQGALHCMGTCKQYPN